MAATTAATVSIIWWVHQNQEQERQVRVKSLLNKLSTSELLPLCITQLGGS